MDFRQPGKINGMAWFRDFRTRSLWYTKDPASGTVSKLMRILTKNRSATSAFGSVHSPVVRTWSKLLGRWKSAGTAAPIPAPRTMCPTTTRAQNKNMRLKNIGYVKKKLTRSFYNYLDALLEERRLRLSGPSSRLTMAAAIHIGHSHFFVISVSPLSGFVPNLFCSMY